MRRFTKYAILSSSLLLSAKIFAQTYRIEPAFTLNEITAVIEGMAFDPVDNNFYFGETVSSKILRYTKLGKPAGNIDAGKDGLVSILGMTVSSARHHLWVCGATRIKEKKVMCLFQYNLYDGSLLNKFPDTSGKSKIFNDVAITANGLAYVTDTEARSLYKMDTVNKIAVLYLQSDSLVNANGITAVGNILYVSTSRGFARVNTADHSISLTGLEGYIIAGNDGLYYYDRSLIGIQNVLFPVTLGRYHLDAEGKKVNTASVLAAEDPAFRIPTTGAIVKDYFYFMTNSNIRHYDYDNSKPLNLDKIEKISIVKIRLKK